MKKNIILTLIALSTYAFAGVIQPTITMRFNDLLDDTTAPVTPKLCLGIATEVEDGVFVGFDSDETDSRIFVTYEFGTMGLGINALGEPQFTIGGNYSTLENLNLSLDYIINNLATDGAGNSIPNELRMSLGVSF
tara:strand:- start:53 stop:457 length:405 start_codon:yes stop_codon:yes gene_type:complete